MENHATPNVHRLPDKPDLAEEACRVAEQALRAPEVRIRDAVAADSEAVATLGGLALGSPHVNPDTGLPAEVQRRGGRISLPYGEGVCRVAQTASGVVGMAYSTPPIDWINEHPATMRHALAQAFSKLDLIAVAEGQRSNGIGCALLAAVEAAERARGVYLLYSDVAARNIPLRRWYKRRGYTFAAPGEPIILDSQAGPLTLVDGGDGYLLAAKMLQPGTRLKRAQVGNEFCLFAQ